MKQTTSVSAASNPAKHAAPKPRCGSRTTRAPHDPATSDDRSREPLSTTSGTKPGGMAASTPGIACASSRAGRITSIIHSKLARESLRAAKQSLQPAGRSRRSRSRARRRGHGRSPAAADHPRTRVAVLPPRARWRRSPRRSWITIAATNHSRTLATSLGRWNHPTTAAPAIAKLDSNASRCTGLAP